MQELSIFDWQLMIGQRVECGHWAGVLIGVLRDDLYISFVGHVHITSVENCKPVLKTLGQMTNEEKEKFKDDFKESLIKPPKSLFIDEYGDFCIDEEEATAKESLWFIREGFDILGWIDKGLAIKKEVNLDT